MIKVILHGRTTKDTEVKKYVTKDGEKLMSVNSIAVNVSKDVVEYLDMIAFGRIADVMKEYVTKGKELLISGELQSREYTDKKGISRKGYSVIVRELEFCGKKNETDDTPDTDALPFA